MPFPTTDRHKILAEQVADLSPTAWQSHPFGPGVLPGLVVGTYPIVNSSSSSSSGGDTPTPTALRVMPLTPSSVSQDGSLGFNLTVPTDLTNVATIRVYPVNTSVTTYKVGSVIPYWQANGSGSQADTVRGSYITVYTGVGSGAKYQVLMTIDGAGTVGWDWPRIH